MALYRARYQYFQPHAQVKYCESLFPFDSTCVRSRLQTALCLFPYVCKLRASRGKYTATRMRLCCRILFPLWWKSDRQYKFVHFTRLVERSVCIEERQFSAPGIEKWELRTVQFPIWDRRTGENGYSRDSSNICMHMRRARWKKQTYRDRLTTAVRGFHWVPRS